MIKQQIGSAIRRQRTALNLTQETLAEKAGLHRTYVSDVERGERNISIVALDQLRIALNLTLAELFA